MMPVADSPRLKWNPKAYLLHLTRGSAAGQPSILNGVVRDRKAGIPAAQFHENFAQYADQVNKEVKEAGPGE